MICLLQNGSCENSTKRALKAQHDNGITIFFPFNITKFYLQMAVLFLVVEMYKFNLFIQSYYTPNQNYKDTKFSKQRQVLGTYGVHGTISNRFSLQLFDSHHRFLELQFN